MVDDNAHSSSQSQSPIFQDVSGSPLEIFVDPGAVTGRPKLVRNLRKAGAHICIAVAQAHLILVDSGTKPGRQFIRDWAQDQDKVVLDYVWARMSLDAGKALLADDDWGGCKAVDDGLPSDEDEDDVEGLVLEKPGEVKSPLPTPRPTPTEASRSSQIRHRSVSPKRSSSSRVAHPDTNHHTSQPQQSQDNGLCYSPTTQEQQPSFPQLSQPLPQSQPAHFHSGLPFPQAQLTYGDMASMQAAFMNPMLPPGQVDAQTMTLMMDVMRHRGINPQSFFSQMFINALQPSFMQSNMLQPMLLFQPVANGLSHPTQEQQSPAADKTEVPMTTESVASPTQPNASSKPRLIPPSSSRRASTPSTPSSPSPSQGKQAGYSPSCTHFPIDSSPTIGTPKSSIQSHSSPSNAPTSPRSRPSGSPRPPGQVFTSHSGRPLSFFVQVDLSNRLSTVNKIKKNGGRIESDNIIADYIILDSAKDKDFASLLHSTMAANKFAMRASFVHDCVEQSAFLDPTEYLFGKPAPQKRKRGRQFNAAPSPTTKVRPQKRREETTTIAGKFAGQRTGIDDPIAYAGLPSPSPPGEETRQPSSGGKYRFSTEEKAYFIRYARILLERDPLASGNSLAQRMHKKMPTHTFGSWRNYISTTASGDLDRLRLEFKSTNQQARIEVEPDCNGASPSKKVKHNSTTTDNDETTVDSGDIQRDLNVICNFFAFGGGNNCGTDDEVWAALARRSTCKSSSSWPEFYANNLTEVNAGIGSRTANSPITKGSRPQT